MIIMNMCLYRPNVAKIGMIYAHGQILYNTI